MQRHLPDDLQKRGDRHAATAAREPDKDRADLLRMMAEAYWREAERLRRLTDHGST
ncbi:hypothetical protein [Sphingosinicella sp. BN140058]|uniref:hypothetical protein n=1 Tax=Sphingosinicella sp. BN140058 TaxID=1892855 RepID=UPI0013E9CF49|nr:hypothetical protein [Sphingosinicella sp. BN140058]